MNVEFSKKMLNSDSTRFENSYLFQLEKLKSNRSLQKFHCKPGCDQHIFIHQEQ